MMKYCRINSVYLKFNLDNYALFFWTHFVNILTKLSLMKTGCDINAPLYQCLNAKDGCTQMQRKKEKRRKHDESLNFIQF